MDQTLSDYFMDYFISMEKRSAQKNRKSQNWQGLQVMSL